MSWNLEVEWMVVQLHQQTRLKTAHLRHLEDEALRQSAYSPPWWCYARRWAGQQMISLGCRLSALPAPTRLETCQEC